MKSDLTEYQSLVEAYYQKFMPNDKGMYVLDCDLYFLGRLSWKNGPNLIKPPPMLFRTPDCDPAIQPRLDARSCR
jgi:hypothetical protein